MHTLVMLPGTSDSVQNLIFLRILAAGSSESSHPQNEIESWYKEVTRALSPELTEDGLERGCCTSAHN
jgi:hypothetical protein